MLYLIVGQWFVCAYAVTNISKIQSESNSQQLNDYKQFVQSCDQYIKDTI